MGLPLRIARRIWGAEAEGRKVSRPAVRIATAGVAVGVAVMIVSVCVVMGFKHTIRDKVAGFGGHIRVANFMTLNTTEAYPIQAGDSAMASLGKVSGVSHVQRFATRQGILKTDRDFLGVALKGVGPEYDTTFLHSCMVEGAVPRFSDKENTGQLLVSKTIASKLMVETGDRLFAYFVDADGLRARRFTISGVYETNLAQYDEAVCYTDLYTAVKLNSWEHDQVEGIEVAVADFGDVGRVAEDFVDKVNRTTDAYGQTYSSKTVEELNPQIFSWLDLLDLNVWIILALMLAVASVTMISGLLIVILERTSMIGVLRAVGMGGGAVRKTFLWFAAFVAGRGLLYGNAAALALVLLQRWFGLVRIDAQTYYVSIVPVEIDIPLILAIDAASLVVCMLALVAPAHLASRLSPAKSMRYE